MILIMCCRMTFAIMSTLQISHMWNDLGELTQSYFLTGLSERMSSSASGVENASYHNHQLTQDEKLQFGMSRRQFVVQEINGTVSSSWGKFDTTWYNFWKQISYHVDQQANKIISMWYSNSVQSTVKRTVWPGFVWNSTRMQKMSTGIGRYRIDCGTTPVNHNG